MRARARRLFAFPPLAPRPRLASVVLMRAVLSNMLRSAGWSICSSSHGLLYRCCDCKGQPASLLLAHRLIGAPGSLKAWLVPDEDDGQTNCSEV